ncbi:MAG: hypothetical protein Q8R15_00470 [Candidatus Micrarchaeota archaeon]|nr:hypothetical protein [Candidatus Micrarchaeota archaeon]
MKLIYWAILLCIPILAGCLGNNTPDVPEVVRDKFKETARLESGEVILYACYKNDTIIFKVGGRHREFFYDSSGQLLYSRQPASFDSVLEGDFEQNITGRKPSLANVACSKISER